MVLIDWGPAPIYHEHDYPCPICTADCDYRWLYNPYTQGWFKGIYYPCGCTNSPQEYDIFPHDKNGQPVEGGKWGVYP